MTSSRRSANISLILVIITLTLVALTSTAAEAVQSLGTADESPIAVPFLGEYEVWCTDRNPAPMNICSNHHGSPAIDLGMDPGTPIHAAGTGVVIEADNFCPARGSCNNGKGNSVIIEHADGRFSRYIHLASVSVAVDQPVSVGDLIGASGESGQSSSPHLHYDEHFPFGTRNDMGAWVGCVDGERVQYPEAFGTSDWNQVPFGSLIVNDGWGCLGGFDPLTEDVDPPRILSGTTHFGITSSSGKASTTYEVRIEPTDGGAEQIVTITGTKLIHRVAPSAPVLVRIREVGGPWSDPVTYDPAEELAVPVCLGLHFTSASLTGSPGVDVIVGTSGDDTIDSRGGDDVICAGDGDDTIFGGLGKDRIFAGAGNDTISGGKGFDIIRGEDGNDSVRGGEGNDTIIGGPGDDTLEGNVGRDLVDGGPGSDHLIGGIGHDTLFGRANDDFLEGRNGRDTLVGGNGKDDLDGNNGRDTLDGGAGADDLDGGDLVDRCSSDPTDTSIVGCEQ